MIVHSDEADGVVMRVNTNPTGDDFFISIYREKDGYNPFMTPTMKVCGPGAGGNLDIPEDIRNDLIRVLSRLSMDK